MFRGKIDFFLQELTADLLIVVPTSPTIHPFVGRVTKEQPFFSLKGGRTYLSIRILEQCLLDRQHQTSPLCVTSTLPLNTWWKTRLICSVCFAVTRHPGTLQSEKNELIMNSSVWSKLVWQLDFCQNYVMEHVSDPEHTSKYNPIPEKEKKKSKSRLVALPRH